MSISSDLPSRWDLPDNSRLTPNQFSFRLPVHVAARIAALCDMYPQRSRTEIVGDLLTEALQRVEQSFPSVAGRQIGTPPDMDEPLFEEVGPASQFRKLANKYYEELEKELGNKNAMPLYTAGLCVTDKELKGR
jgi:hypothetical protein